MPLSLIEKRDELLKKARAIVDSAPGGMTPEQYEEVKSYMDDVDKITPQIESDAKSAQLMERVFSANPDGVKDTPADAAAATLGDHFVKHAGDMLTKQAAGAHIDFSAPDFHAKAANDPAVRPAAGSGLDAWGTDFQRGFVNAVRQKLVIADLMGSANVTNSTIKYLVEKMKAIAEGGPATVAEAAAKPYGRFDTFDIITESLAKIAGLTKISDEMAEDYAFVVDWINNQLIYEVSVVEEAQLLNGDGLGSNLKGLLNRDGLQTHNIAAGAEFDGLYTAMQMVPQATNLYADALVVNPADYIKRRLQKDANGQYLAGGPFQGSYGNGGIMINPPVWGLTTIDTNAIPAGTYVLGAFRQASTVLRKGGLRVDSTNSNADDFEHNLITLRAEERVGLMVSRPAAFVTGTIGAAG